VWRHGKEQSWFAEDEDRFATSVTAFLFDKAGESIPVVSSNFITELTAAPEVMIFFHLRSLEVPSVQFNERHTVSRLAIPNRCRLVVRYGYNEEVVRPNLAAIVLEQLRLYFLDCCHTPNIRKVSHSTPTKDQGEKGVAVTYMDEEKGEAAWRRKLEDERLPEELARLDRAFSCKALYIIGN